MEAVRGNRSFSETTTSLAPFSRSPERYLPFSRNLEPVFTETPVQNDPFRITPFDTLESAFSRLSVSAPKNQEIGYHGLVGGEFLDGAGYGFGGGLARTGLERNNLVGGPNVGFDGVMTVGPDIGRWDTFTSRSCQPSNLNGNGYLLDPRRNDISNEISILPSSNQNGLAAAGAAAAAGSSGACSSRNKNVMRSSYNSRNNINNQTNNSSRRPHLLQEPFNCLSLGDLRGRFVSLAKDQYVSSRNNINNQTNNSSRRPHWLQEPLNCSSLEDLRGRIVSLAKDQYGCRVLQRALDEAPKEEIDMILMEVIDHVGELMIDPFANYVVQKLVDVCNEEKKSEILSMAVKDSFRFVNICLNVHGTRAVQKLLENITTQQQISLVMSALSPFAVALTKDMNGHRVIQYCLRNFSAEDNKYLLNEVAYNCYQIATDKSGCCALQHCVDYSEGEARVQLVRAVTANALHLAQDLYGNYVVQHILDLQEPQITESLLRQLEGNYASLSFNRYASNVVEKCLEKSGEQQSTRIIMELLSSRDVSMLLLDRYGNFVIQSALKVSKGFVYDALVNLVSQNFETMRSNVYGRWVLAWFNKKEPLRM